MTFNSFFHGILGEVGVHVAACPADGAIRYSFEMNVHFISSDGKDVLTVRCLYTDK